METNSAFKRFTVSSGNEQLAVCQENALNRDSDGIRAKGRSEGGGSTYICVTIARRKVLPRHVGRQFLTRRCSIHGLQAVCQVTIFYASPVMRDGLLVEFRVGTA
uniref:Uncharacterized protein n=1 Tax=Vespula pensylvanica TaxID=30213 RepID=A0A834P8U2_VESPE|nr:hypothetical protein H0235_005173 [Vespula pensylvanica]